MATLKQIEANRNNARLSTGPRTPEGKARSSANRTSHGLFAASPLLPGEDPAEFQDFLDSLRQHFHAYDLTEVRCVQEMADADWRLRRTRALAADLLSAKIAELQPAHPDASPIHLQALAFDALQAGKGSSFPSLLRYEAKFERQYERAYKIWLAYQAEMGKKARQTAAERTVLRRALDGQNEPNSTLTHQEINTLRNEPNSPDPPATPPEPAPVQIARRALCPCGSGQKYKRCCGRSAPPVLFKHHPKRPHAA
jgi:uncharacterized protein YecA (UPF0149 family)